MGVATMGGFGIYDRRYTIYAPARCVAIPDLAGIRSIRPHRDHKRCNDVGYGCREIRNSRPDLWANEWGQTNYLIEEFVSPYSFANVLAPGRVSRGS